MNCLVIGRQPQRPLPPAPSKHRGSTLALRVVPLPQHPKYTSYSALDHGSPSLNRDRNPYQRTFTPALVSAHDPSSTTNRSLPIQHVLQAQHTSPQSAVATGDLTLLLTAIQTTCKFIATNVRRAGLLNL